MERSDILKKIEDIKKDDDVIKVIFLSRFKKIRENQLAEQNRCRMLYNDNRFSSQFEILDAAIDEVEQDIFLCLTMTQISKKYNVSELAYASWLKGSIHKERLKEVIQLSAEKRMEIAEKVLQDAMNNKDFQIQHAQVTRELSLHHSRMAGFLNQNKYGKKPDVEIGIQPNQVMTPEQMQNLINRLTKKNEIDQPFAPYSVIKEQVDKNVENIKSIIENNSKSDSIKNNSEIEKEIEDENYF